MAAHAKQHDDDDVIAEINIVPFVDIVLVLLIIFMLTSTVIVRAALKVELPKAATAGSVVDESANIVYTRDGELFLDGEAVARDVLAERIRARAASAPNLTVVIAADQGSEYGRVVGLIDLVKQNGVKSFALNIETQPSETRSLR